MALPIIGPATNQGYSGDTWGQLLYFLGPYTAPVSGTVLAFGACQDTAQSVTIGLYTNNSGSPGTLVAVSNQLSAVAADNVPQWQTVNGTSGSVTAGQSYFIAVYASANIHVREHAGTNQMYSQTIAYSSGSMPATASASAFGSYKYDWSFFAVIAPPSGGLIRAGFDAGIGD